MPRRLLIALAMAAGLADLRPVAARQRITADQWGWSGPPAPRCLDGVLATAKRRSRR